MKEDGEIPQHAKVAHLEFLTVSEVRLCLNYLLSHRRETLNVPGGSGPDGRALTSNLHADGNVMFFVVVVLLCRCRLSCLALCILGHPLLVSLPHSKSCFA